MANSADPDQLASSEANWSGSTLFVKAGHILRNLGSAGQGLSVGTVFITLSVGRDNPEQQFSPRSDPTERGIRCLSVIFNPFHIKSKYWCRQAWANSLEHESDKTDNSEKNKIFLGWASSEIQGSLTSFSSFWVCFVTDTVFDLITAHTPISALWSNIVVFRLQPVYFVSTYLLLYKNICWGYSFELPRQVEAIQMSTYNICFYKKSRKIILHKHH